jgi:hypothetical protein
MPGRKHGLYAAGHEGVHQRVGIVATVGKQIDRGQPVEQHEGLRRVVALAGDEAEAHGHRLQLRSQAAAAAPEGLRPVLLRVLLAC